MKRDPYGVPPKRKFRIELCVLKNVLSQVRCKYSDKTAAKHVISMAKNVTFVGFSTI